MDSNFKPGKDQLQQAALAALVTGSALAAYKGVTAPVKGLEWLAIGLLVVLVRELGQRTIAEWEDAYVDLEVSMQGAATTVLAAMTAYLTQLPIVALFPVTSSFSGKTYEHWGKSIDAVWMKRQFWIVLGGLLALFAGWFASLGLGFSMAAEAFGLFTFFQLLPFDYKDIPTGALDGAYILRWSGFYWLIMFGTSIIGLVLTL